jgi:hypothetical protein
VIITITAADLRDPMDSEQVYVAIEGPIEREDGGFCYCYPALDETELAAGPGEPFPLHFHLRVSGKLPEASPRYYELPVW